MIYLDNSATTYPKPATVINAVYNSFKYYSANPGRSGHKMSLKTAEKVFNCRQKFKSFFNINDENNVIFTPSCTFSLNTVIKGLLKENDHIIISSLEHNSVLRPVEKLKQTKNVQHSIAEVDLYDNDKTIDNFRSKINEHTRLIVCTHASNVFGIRLPVERICALAHQYNIPFCLDSAQSAGVFDIDINNSNFDFVCCAGHKGLYGPMGIGVLIINNQKLLDTLIEGGTGSESSNPNVPVFNPDRFESGTLNIPGVIGLSAGLDFVQNKGIYNIAKSEIKLLKRLYHSLSDIKGVKLYTKEPDLNICAPVLSFSIKDTSSEEVSGFLNQKYNIATRAGLHCASLAHKFMGSEEFGTVRISPSYFTTERDISVLTNAVYNFCKFRLK